MTDLLLSCRDYVLTRLRSTMLNRANDPDWIASERFAVAQAANDWASCHGIDRRITVYDVERIEGGAMGHVDYASKLCLYVAELVVVSNEEGRGASDVRTSDPLGADTAEP